MVAWKVGALTAMRVLAEVLICALKNLQTRRSGAHPIREVGFFLQVRQSLVAKGSADHSLGRCSRRSPHSGALMTSMSRTRLLVTQYVGDALHPFGHRTIGNLDGAPANESVMGSDLVGFGGVPASPVARRIPVE